MNPKEKKNCKLQATAEPYTCYVVNQLVGIKGRGPSDVVAFIVKDWIGDHRDELADYGIDVPMWQAQLGKSE